MVLNMVLVGMLLILLGFLVIFLAILLSFLRILKSRKEEFKVEKHEGAVVMIGPFPIVFASDPKTAKVLIILAIILTTILIVLTLISYGLMRLGWA